LSKSFFYVDYSFSAVTFLLIYTHFHLVCAAGLFLHYQADISCRLEPNPEYSKYYAGGGEILDYIRRTVSKYKLDRDLKLEHEVVGTTWSEDKSKWSVEIKHGSETFTDECDVLVSARGFLSKWKWPSIEGLQSFKGQMMHSADWQDEYSLDGKTVALVGNGSSAIQILPQLVPIVKHVTNFARASTWITERHTATGYDDANHVYTEEERDRFRKDREYLQEYRRTIQRRYNMAFRRVCLLFDMS